MDMNTKELGWKQNHEIQTQATQTLKVIYYNRNKH
jgi:hypothetical protein